MLEKDFSLLSRRFFCALTVFQVNRCYLGLLYNNLNKVKEYIANILYQNTLVPTF